MAPFSPPTAISPSTFHLTFSKALRTYKKRTKIDILLDALAFVFQSCNTSAAALSVLKQQVQVQSWSDDEGLMTSLSPSVDSLYSISSCIEPGAGLVTTHRRLFNVCFT